MADAKNCDVCYGTPGRFPIHDRFGKQLYEIECPECGGTGKIEADENLPTFQEMRGILKGSN